MKPFAPGRKNRSDTILRFPATDCHYRTPRFVDYSAHCAGTARPSFVAISRDYFNHEARKGFAMEAAAFALVTIITAPAIFDCSRALFEFMRITGM